MTRESEFRRSEKPCASRLGKSGAVVAVVAATLLGSGAGRADNGAQKRAVAQALFDEARRLSEQGRHAEACPKFRESQSLDPGIGTLYNLGECLEMTGRTASAWAAFHEAADMARIASQPQREQAARARAVALEPQLMRLQIDVPEAARLPGIEVRRDGIVVGSGQWGVAVPVDPGAHRVVVSAPGKVTRELNLSLSERGATRVVHVEPLEDAPVADTPSPVSTRSATALEPMPPQADAEGRVTESGTDSLGWVLGGAGVVGVGIGAVLAVSAKSKYDDSLAYCDTADTNRCKAEGVSLRDDARARGNYATVAFGLGAAALTVGVVLIASSDDAPDSSSARLQMGPSVEPGAASWSLRGRF